ncbi:hypothetical protein GY45DRAFT_1373322 [Cubamyces sp. BRFM 1775]|nr:hypothetical protein GY45DRAFT_1373322 [Cubamyces sp. BRFM 1775]
MLVKTYSDAERSLESPPYQPALDPDELQGLFENMSARFRGIAAELAINDIETCRKRDAQEDDEREGKKSKLQGAADPTPSVSAASTPAYDPYFSPSVSSTSAQPHSSVASGSGDPPHPSRRPPRLPQPQQQPHVVSPTEVWYQDLTGSSVETISHLRENGRITFLFHNFNGSSRITHLSGAGKVYEFGSLEYEALIPLEERRPSSRAVIVIDVHKVDTHRGHSSPGARSSVTNC